MKYLLWNTKHFLYGLATEPMVPYWFWMKIYYLPCRFNNIDNNNENDDDDDDDDDKLFTLIWLLFFIGDKRNRLQYDPFYTNTEARKVQFFIFLSRSTSRQSCTSLTRWEEGYIWWNKGNSNIKLYAIIKKKNPKFVSQPSRGVTLLNYKG